MLQIMRSIAKNISFQDGRSKPLPYQHNPNFANRQIFKRTAKQKFIFRKVNAIALIIDSELLDANGHVFIRNPLNDNPVTDD